MWWAVPASRSAASRLPVEVVKNRRTGSASNDGAFETSTTAPAPARPSATPAPEMVSKPVRGEAAMASCPRRCSSATTCEPSRPVPPTTTTFMTSSPVGPWHARQHRHHERNTWKEQTLDHAAALGMIEAVTTAFDEHDLDAIMDHFADDAVFESPRGSDPWGHRFVGHDEIREAFAGRFSGIPDVRYTEDDHFVDGDRGVSEWT